MQPIHRWQQQYLGTTTLPRTLGVAELQAFFVYSSDEIAQIKSRRTAPLRLAAAIQLGFMRMSGSPLADLHSIPARLMRFVAAQLKRDPIPITSLRSVYDRPKTRYEHQWWAMQVLGFRKAEEGDLALLATFLDREAVTSPGTDYLMGRGMAWLYQHKFIPIAPRDLRTMAVRSMSLSEIGLLRLIHEQIPPATIAYWFAKVMAPHDGERSALEWLQKPPLRKSVNQIRGRMDRVEFLKELGVHKLDVHQMYQDKVKVYAKELKNMRPGKVRELQDPTRSLRLVCFLQWALAAATDAAIMLGANRVTKIVSKAYKAAETLEAKSAKSAHDAIADIFDKAADATVEDADFRQYVLLLKEQYEPPRFPTRAAAARWILSEPNSEIRALLSELGKLDLQAEKGNEAVERAAILQTLYQGKETTLPRGIKIPMPRPWREIIEGEDRERAFRAVEAATLIGLRKALKSGAAFVTHSEKFRGRRRLLIGDEDWQRDRLLRYAQLNLPLEPGSFLDSLTQELRLKLHLLAEAVRSGRLGLDNGRFRVPRLSAKAANPDAKQNKDELFAKIGVVQFPELILEMDSRTGFSKVILGRMARSAEELLEVYAGMVAHGCALDASQVALTMPQLDATSVLRGMQLFENVETVRAANAAVVNFHKRLPICSAWGDGSLASSDMMSMDVSKHIWAARMDYRRKQPSVGTYTLVADFWSVLYDLPIILNERQAGAAIEAALRQTEVEIDRLAVDTHGYTDFAMALAKLLGFALCPRLAHVAERRLYIPSSMKDVDEALADVAQPIVSLRLIEQEWDNLVRIAASVETGHAMATVALARFGSAASDSATYRAGVHLGRLIRSIYLCDYLLSEELRRLVNRILVHGEALHQLQRAIYTGTFSKPRGQHLEDLYATSGALTLMLNLCLAWTTNKMQEHLLGDRAYLTEDEASWLEGTSPAHHGNINFRGIFSFPLQRYAKWLFDAGSGGARA
jgi:TnpA family transposase